MKSVMMIKCLDCGLEDFEPKFIALDEFGGGREFCPDCRSDNIAVGYECPLCGGYSEFSYCEDCRKRIKTRFQRLLHENFSDEEIDVLNEVYEGEEIK